MEIINFSIKKPHGNSALLIRGVLNVLFVVKGFFNIFFGVSLLLLTRNPGNVEKVTK